MGTHNVHRAAELLRAARATGPITEILDAAVLDDHAMFPSALPAVRETSYNAWVTIQIGCDNSCAFCIVPAVRGVEISRPFDEIVDEVARARRRRRHRGHAARPERQQLRPRPPAGGPPRRRRRRRRVRPLFADLLRAVGAVDGIRRVRFTSPHPKDMRPETFAAMAETPAVCQQLHYPLQAGSDRVLAAMHRGYTADALPRAARRGPPRRARPRRVDRHHRRLPRRDRRRLRSARSRSPPRPGSTTPSRSSSRPAPAPRRPTLTDRFVDPAVAGERFDRLRVVIERSALAANQARVGRVEEVLVEGPSKKDPTVLAGAHAASTASSTSPRRAPLRAGTYADGRDHRRRAAPPHRALRRARSPSRRTARASPSPRSDDGRPRRSSSLGPTASGKSDVAMAAARAVAGTEIVAVDAMQVYRGMDIGTAKPTPADRAAVRHHGIDLVEPDVDFTVADYRRGLRRGGRRRSPARPAARRRHRPVPHRRHRPPRRARPVAGRPRRARGRRRHRRRCAARLRGARPGRGGAHRAGQPAPHRAGARGHASAAAGRSARSVPASARTRRPTPSLIGLRWPRPRLADADRAAGARR